VEADFGAVVHRRAAGARDEFSEFVGIRTPALLRTAYLLTGDQHLAEDLVQDALARTHRAARRLDGFEHYEAYTRSALYHLQVSRWRRRRVAEVSGVSFDAPDPAGDHAGRVALRLSLERALDRLTRRQRAVLVLRFFEDQSEAQTAQALGCTVGTVKSQTSKALARLREIVPDLAPGDEGTHDSKGERR
jgi:RNA polymerase sigma-70 factor (sigma-E family)